MIIWDCQLDKTAVIFDTVGLSGTPTNNFVLTLVSLSIDGNLVSVGTRKFVG